MGNPIVLIGSNNTGETSATQAPALWGIGVKRWNEKRVGKSTQEKHHDMTVAGASFAILHPSAIHLSRDLHVQDIRRVDGCTRTNNVRIDTVVEGEAMRTSFGHAASSSIIPMRVILSLSPAAGQRQTS